MLNLLPGKRGHLFYFVFLQDLVHICSISTSSNRLWLLDFRALLFFLKDLLDLASSREIHLLALRNSDSINILDDFR